MDLSPSPTLPKARNHQWIIGVVMVVLFAFGGLVLVYRARARAERERQAAEERARTASQAATEDATAARAIAKYLARIQGQLRDRNAAFRRLQRQQVFSWNIHSRTEIEADRQMVQDFLTTNSRLTDSIQYGAGLIRAELDTAKVPASVRDSAIALYTKSQAESLPLRMHLRHCDQALGENVLAVLGLLDLNWGAWHRDEATGRLDFTNSITLATFKDYAEKAKAAVADQEAAQEELNAYQMRHPKG